MEEEDLGQSFRDIADEGKDLIRKANSMPIDSVMKFYKVKVDNNINKKIRCPFKSHLKGKESSASFYYYPETNSFYCFGCKSGIYATDFVSKFENISKYDAALKILSLFDPNSNMKYEVQDYDDSDDILDLYITLSNKVKKFKKTHHLKKDIDYLNLLMVGFDDLNIKHKLNSEALQTIVDKIIYNLDNYGK